MTADNPTRRTTRPARPLQGSRQRLRSLARRGLWRWARPYARRRARRAGGDEQAFASGVTVERQGEQVERLEDLVRELVLTAESLRREIARARRLWRAAARSRHRSEGGPGRLMQVITLATLGSLPRARTLGRSLQRHQPDWPLDVLLLALR